MQRISSRVSEQQYRAKHAEQSKPQKAAHRAAAAGLPRLPRMCRSPQFAAAGPTSIANTSIFLTISTSKVAATLLRCVKFPPLGTLVFSGLNDCGWVAFSFVMNCTIHVVGFLLY
eukprot:COSAG02_NODE_3725_length_6318_cov_3.342660_7_plen_115_part_00